MVMAKKMTPILESLRPKDWIKNIFVFAGAVFGQKLLLPGILTKVSVGFLLFSLAASSVYLFNDSKDIRHDRLHPHKAKRPIPSGSLKQKEALVIAVSMIGFVIPSSFYLNVGFALWVLVYLGLNVAYTLKLKHLVIIDVVSNAAGYVIRVMAGCSLVALTPSIWLIICTFTLALFLSFCKRRQEQSIVINSGSASRPVLSDYRIGSLDKLILIATAATLGSYILYTISQKGVANFGSGKLIWTVPLVLYGLLRYLHLIFHRKAGDDPIATFFSDRPLLFNVLLWVVAVLIIIYGCRQ